MAAWLIPLICTIIASAGGLWATKGKQSTDKSDILQKLVDQLQEERTEATGSRDREVGLRRQDADYIVTLRRQVEALGGQPAPYPGLGGA